MKKAVSHLVLLAILGLATLGSECNCHEDGGFLLSINGQYSGTYRYIEIAQGTDTLVDTSQLVDCSFRSGEFSITKSSLVPDSERVFCDVVGEYELGSGVELFPLDSNTTDADCVTSWGPFGLFAMDQTTDTLKLRCDVTSGTLRIVRDLKLLPALI